RSNPSVRHMNNLAQRPRTGNREQFSHLNRLPEKGTGVMQEIVTKGSAGSKHIYSRYRQQHPYLFTVPTNSRKPHIFPSAPMTMLWGKNCTAASTTGPGKFSRCTSRPSFASQHKTAKWSPLWTRTGRARLAPPRGTQLHLGKMAGRIG